MISTSRLQSCSLLIQHLDFDGLSTLSFSVTLAYPLLYEAVFWFRVRLIYIYVDERVLGHQTYDVLNFACELRVQ